MAKQNLSKARRLIALRALLAEIACGIRNAQEGLIENEVSANTVCLVVDALGRLGWIADQCCVIAGEEFPPVVGDAYSWLLSSSLRECFGKHGAEHLAVKG